MPTVKFGLPLITGNQSADVVRDLNALAQAIDENVGGGDATETLITDTGSYYTSDNVEGALQEIGQTLNAVRGDLITSATTMLGA